jgi:hydrogenase expression/formation protein HypD
VAGRTWRGIGEIPASGLVLAPEFAAQDAERRFAGSALGALGALGALRDIRTEEHPECIAGEILQGTKVPTDCAAYGVRCTPRTPLGAPMVSAEGTCAAFHHAGRRRPEPSLAGRDTDPPIADPSLADPSIVETT